MTMMMTTSKQRPEPCALRRRRCASGVSSERCWYVSSQPPRNLYASQTSTRSHSTLFLSLCMPVVRYEAWCLPVYDGSGPRGGTFEPAAGGSSGCRSSEAGQAVTARVDQEKIDITQDTLA